MTDTVAALGARGNIGLWSFASPKTSPMWIVRLALRRPYTFVVMAVAIALLGGAAIWTMPVTQFILGLRGHKDQRAMKAATGRMVSRSIRVGLV